MFDNAKTVMIGEVKYVLPFIDLIPFDAEQDKQLGEAIEEAGEVLEAVVSWREQNTAKRIIVTDGAHRAIHASRLNFDKLPVKLRSFASEEEARADCEQRNLARRHLTESLRQAAKKARIERIAELSRNGVSQRAIAEQVGVSQPQVSADLKASGDNPLITCSTSVVTGTDGKTYPKDKICSRCKRLRTPIKDCSACLRARKESAAKAKATRARKAAERAENVKDDFGNPIPGKRLTDWQDQWIQDTYDFLTVHAEQLRDERLVSRFEKRAKKYPWFDAKEFAAGVGFIIQYFDELIFHVKTYRPAGVCKDCTGNGCDKCRSSGFVPRFQYLGEKAPELP